MIMREWRGRVPHEKTDAYEAFLHTSGIADYGATPGNHGIWMLVDRTGEATEFTLLTLWESEAAIAAFAGADIRLAHYYPEDDGFLLEKHRFVRHYEVRWPRS
jgi:heme-degrading monooxygenase HmoA